MYAQPEGEGGAEGGAGWWPARRAALGDEPWVYAQPACDVPLGGGVRRSVGSAYPAVYLSLPCPRRTDVY